MENEPLKIFMALSDVERNRAKPLEAETVDRLAREYRSYERAVSAVFRSAGAYRQDHHCSFWTRRTR